MGIELSYLKKILDSNKAHYKNQQSPLLEKYLKIVNILGIKIQYSLSKSVHRFFSEKSENDQHHSSIKSLDIISSALYRFYRLELSLPNFLSASNCF